MKTNNFLSIVATVLMLSACVAPGPKININDSQSVASSVTVQRDDFKKLIRYTGPNAAKDDGDVLYLRAWKTEKTGEILYQIYIADYYSGEWRFYNSAYDSNGERLETTLISRDVDRCSKYGCSYTEHLGLNITKEYLEKNKGSGINFKLSGKAGEAIFFIPGTYVQAFLSVVDGRSNIVP
jgi:hypothetical protein